MWRLVFSDVSSVTYTEASSMSQDELAEANAALDIVLEQLNKPLKPKRRG